MKTLFTSLVFLALALPALAEDEPKLKPDFSGLAHWSKLSFPGQPYLVDPRNNLERLLKMSKRCEGRVKDLLKDLNRYGYAAAAAEDKRTEKKAENKYKDIKNKLADADRAGCGEDVRRAYAVGSLALIANYGWEYPTNAHVIASVTYTPNLYVTLAAAYLANTNRIQFAKINPGARGRFMGAYVCEENLIYIDTDLRPIDLAALVTHEIDHLFRDRFSPKAWELSFGIDDNALLQLRSFKDPDGAKAEFQSRLQQRSAALEARRPKMTVLLDEVLAVVQSAYRQVLLRDTRPNTGKVHHWFPQFTTDHPVHDPYRLSADVTLYTQGGPLLRLKRPSTELVNFLAETFLGIRKSEMDRFIKARILGELYATLPLYYDTNNPQSQQYLRALRDLLQQQASWALSEKDAQEIFSLVFAAYFSGQALDEEAQGLLSLAVLERMQDPLSELELQAALKAQRTEFPYLPENRDRRERYLPGISISPDRTRQLIAYALTDLAELDDGLRDPERKLTPACRQFHEWADAGKLDGYIGLSPGLVIQPGPGGVRPGEGPGGVRPAIPARLCVETKGL